MIESVHDETVATVLDKAASAENRESLLKVMVQVASSEEEKKLGLLSSSSVHRLCRHIVEDCPSLEFCGLMTNSLPSFPHRLRRDDVDNYVVVNRTLNNDAVVV